MLLSDTWGSQPAVLQLLPFSANHALSLPPSDGSGTRGQHQRQATTDVCREFPVLAVTRGQGTTTATTTTNNHNNYSSSRSRSGPGVRVSSHGGLSPDPPERCASERLPRPAHAVLQSQLYGRSGTHSARVGSHGTEPMTGYHLRDQDSDILGYTTGSDAFMEIFENEAGEKNGRPLVGGLLPKPAFQMDDVGPVYTLTSTFAGSSHGSPAQDHGRLALHHRHPMGLRRSLTLTPGELELQKHRQQLERVSSGRLQLDASYALAQPDVMGHNYHKLNVRDLPRSTTPLHDNDPDRLNMKQVIAFLQTKGKSQADAVELPRELKAKVAQDVQLLTARRSARGQLKGRVRRPSLLPSSSSSSTLSSAAAAGLASGTRHATPSSLHGSAKLHPKPVLATLAPFADQGGRDFASFICPLTCPATRSSSELKPEPCATGTLARSRPAGRAVSEYTPRPTGETADNVRSGLQGELGSLSDTARRRSSKSKSAGTRTRQQQQKKPFRLHRFLAMVPSPRDSAPPGFAASGASSPRPATRAESEALSRATQKERTLCLDLANQSRSQASLQRSKTADWENPTKVRKGSFSQNCNDGSYGGSSSSIKVRYRISAVSERSRPGSLRLADETVDEPHHKVISDHGNYRTQDGKRAQIRDSGDQAGIHSFDYRNNDEDTKIIRLPYVMVDPDDDENAAVMGGKTTLAKDHTHSAGRSQVHQHSVNKTHQSAYRSSSEQSSDRDYGDVGNLKAYSNNNDNNKDNNNSDMISSSYQAQKQFETTEALTLDSVGQSASSLTVNPSYSSTNVTVSCAQSSASEDLSPYLQSEGSAERRTDLPDMEALADAASALNADLDSLHAGSGTSVDSVSSSGLYRSSRDNFTASAASFAGDPSTASVVSMIVTLLEHGVDEQTEQQNGYQPVHWKDSSSDTRFPYIRQTGQIDVGLDNIFGNLQPKVTKKVKVNVPSARARPVKQGDDAIEQKTDCVTLSLRKERHRTRESTYMSEIGDRDASSEKSAEVRLLSCVRSNVRPNLASDGSPSLVS